MMKFLQESTDTPHIKGVVKEHLPLPQPGVDEYRRYFDEHTVKVQQTESDSDGNITVKEVEENTASFVSCSCEHEPTDDEWRELLTSEGYTAEQIAVIIPKAE